MPNLMLILLSLCHFQIQVCDVIRDEKAKITRKNAAWVLDVLWVRFLN